MRKILSNKQMTALGLVIGIPATILEMEAMTTIESHADMVKVIGTFESTTLDVHVPMLNSFTYNPNTKEMYAQKFSIESFTNAPITMNLQEIEVSDDSPWKPTLIAPNTYTDNQWTNLTKEESKEQVALGLKTYDGEGWLSFLNKVDLWSTEVNNSKIGTIKNHGVIEGQPTLIAGNSLSIDQILTANYIFEFSLEE